MGKTNEQTEHTNQAFESAFQAIYEQLILAYADALATLKRLQDQSKPEEPDRVATGQPPASSHAVTGPSDASPATADSAPYRFYTTGELEQSIREALERTGVPTRSDLIQIMHELDILNAALDQRLAAGNND
ncbi:MAG: hypothetical protein ACK2U9_13895 [Anaerolineae bacterium]|jgi:hypothetical protein